MNNSQVRGRARSLTLLSDKPSLGSTTDPNVDPSEDWVQVDERDLPPRPHCNWSVYETEHGFRTENVHLYLSDMYIGSAERAYWKKLTDGINFAQDPGPVHTQSVHSTGPSTSSDSGPYTNPQFENLGNTIPDTNSDAVVQSLVEYFKDNKRSPEEDLVCVVSYESGTDDLIAPSFRDAFPPDEMITTSGTRIRLGGSMLWAPPRRKFIFDLPDKPKDLQTMLAEQNYCCAGCGLKLTKVYEKRARLCHYYNKLFCQCCHRGVRTYIPARILHQWNFRQFPVCDIAESFLKEHESNPVFDVHAIEPSMFQRVKNLRNVRRIRLVISHVWQFIQLCPKTKEQVTRNGNLRTMFESIPSRFRCLDQVDIYSLVDFERIENGNLLEMLEPLEKWGVSHVVGCSVCQQRGFLCPICMHPTDILFPFQVDRIFRCVGCGSLLHNKCYIRWFKKYQVWHCGRCERLRKKRLNQLRNDSYNSD